MSWYSQTILWGFCLLYHLSLMLRMPCLLSSPWCGSFVHHGHESLELPLSVVGHDDGCAEVTGTHTSASLAEEPSQALLTPHTAWAEDTKRQQQLLCRYCDVHDQPRLAAHHQSHRQGQHRNSLLLQSMTVIVASAHSMPEQPAMPQQTALRSSSCTGWVRKGQPCKPTHRYIAIR